MMPRWITLLMTCFLGLPGAILWLSGLLAVIAACTFLWLEVRPGTIKDAWGGLGLAAAASAIGWLMMIAASLLSRSEEDPQINPKRLLPCIALDIGVALLIAIATASLIAAAVRWTDSVGSDGRSPAISGVVLAAVALGMKRCATLRRRAWGKEQLSSADTP